MIKIVEDIKDVDIYMSLKRYKLSWIKLTRKSGTGEL